MWSPRTDAPRRRSVARKNTSSTTPGVAYDLAADTRSFATTRAAAEQFTREDPFILEGLVKSFEIKDWNDTLLPE